MAPHPTPDLSAIAAGDRVAIRRRSGFAQQGYSWATATVQRVTAARITAYGHTYRRSDGMRLGDGGPHQAAYLFPYDHPAAVAARHQATLDAARADVAAAVHHAADACRNREPAPVIRERLDAAQTALDRLEQLQTQAPHTPAQLED